MEKVGIRQWIRRRRLLGGLSVLVAVVALALGLAACGGGSPSAANSGSSNSSTSSTSSNSGNSGGSSSAGNSGSSSAGNSGGSSSDSASTAAIAFASCVRKHGVPNFPDSAIKTSSSGGVSVGIPSNLGVSSAQLQAAMSACKSLLPKSASSGGSSSNSNTQAVLKFAQCMRSNGVPNFPEPNSSGQVLIQGGSNGVNQNSPAYQKASTTCQHLLPAGSVGG